MTQNPQNHPPSQAQHLGLAGRMAQAFIDSKLTPLIILTSILLGLAAIALLPREEEPQIIVPMVDVMVSMPGFSAKEVEQRATRPMEKLLWEIPGVEYVYSTSQPGQSLVIVRFKVGEDIEDSLVKLNQKLQSNFDRIPPGVRHPLIKPRSIDDVPILALTLHGGDYDHEALRRMASQLEEHIKQAPQVGETTLIGGSKRTIRIKVDPIQLEARGLTLSDLPMAIQSANQEQLHGELITNNTAALVETGGFLRSVSDVESILLGVHQSKPVYLRDVASIEDAGEEPSQYVFFGHGKASGQNQTGEVPAVTISIAKRPGTNAIAVAEDVLTRLEALKGHLIPADLELSITRHYGETAAEKSNELLFHMGIAVVSVSLLILFALGKRESLIVAIAIPSTLALTLLVFYLYGYTLNRITLFALIFSIGILVDDAIVVVENIVRHRHLAKNKRRSLMQIAVEAVGEVGNPTILATFAVIFAVLPMAFVGGLMGPYMRPIPVGAGAAMFFSLLIAFIVTPWAAVRLLGKSHASHSPAPHDGSHAKEDFLTRSYRAFMNPLIEKARWRWGFLILITGMLLAAMALAGIGWVQVKMLPFDNKSEVQVILNMPEGSTLEHTANVTLEMAEAIRDVPEVTDYQTYIGTAAPFNFNGLVRHYFLRAGSHMADIQVNLVDKHERSAQSHDVAKRIRNLIAPIAARYDASLTVAEVPPGPPVLQTLVAEIYGPDEDTRHRIAHRVKEIFESTDGVVDVDWYVEADQVKQTFEVDKEKAALHGLRVSDIEQTLQTAITGTPVGLLHADTAREPVHLHLEIPETFATSIEDLQAIKIRSPLQKTAHQESSLIPMSELVTLTSTTADKSIYHKNLMPVTYVTADVAGAIESPVYAIFEINQALKQLNLKDIGMGQNTSLTILNASMPETDVSPSMKWDGEWHITLEVFRDLGLAFAAVLVLIYVLMVGWFKSFLTPLIVMVAIPFSLVGIMPAHGLMGAFFSATSMIGFMAGGGIVVRNSIILVDFIEQRLSEGMPLSEAVVDAGAVRFRPMMLTAMAVVVGAGVILFDPIFQGLAIALMAGEIASLFISRMAVPVLYYMANK